MDVKLTYNAVDYKALLIKVLEHETDIEWLLLQSGWTDEEKVTLRELGPKSSEY